MDKKYSQSEASSPSKKDSSPSDGMTVTAPKTSSISKNRSEPFVIEDRRRVTLPKFPEDLSDVVRDSDNITESSEDWTDEDRQTACKCVVGLLVMSALILGVGFGLGWWCGSSNTEVPMKS